MIAVHKPTLDKSGSQPIPKMQSHWSYSNKMSILDVGHIIPNILC